jgi:hypothetical protein
MWYARQVAIVIATLAAASSLPAAPAAADDHPHKCTLETLAGQYLVAANGRLFPPAFGVSKESVSAAAGYSIYNGDGTGTDYVTFTVNGTNANVTSPAATQYTLNADCTGTKTVLPYGPHFNIFVAIDGSGLTEVATDPGFAVSTMDFRVDPLR